MNDSHTNWGITPAHKRMNATTTPAPSGPEAARIGPCLTVFWITQISPDYYRILTDQGWCDANRSEARRLVDAWYQNLNL